MQLSGKKVTVVGLGESGLGAVRLLCAQGAHVTANDARDESSLGDRAHEVRALGAELLTGGHEAAQLGAQDLIVVSPGVPPLDQLSAAERAGAVVISEIELAWQFIEAQVAAVTGTNGKSTVTTLLGQMAAASGRPAFVGGNLGRPLVEVARDAAAGPDGAVVVELSSFQLERVREFRAHVALLLNVSDDHLDRYPDFDAYVAAKARIFERQRPTDFACVPADDARLLELARQGAGQLKTFGPGGDVRIEGAHVVDTLRGDRYPLADLKIRGEHNVLNVCAAVLAASLLRIDAHVIARILREFTGLPHRMQWVAEHRGVRFYDDSKATNVGAAVAAVRGLQHAGGKVVLLAGGKDKGGSYAPLVAALRDVGRAVVVFGQAAALIERAVRADSLLPVLRASSMEEAVRASLGVAEPGDAVLLAPACASFDMFRSYGHRGDVFQTAVRGCTGEGG